MSTNAALDPAPTAAPEVKLAKRGGTAISSIAGGSGVGGTTCTVTAFASASAAAKSCSNILLSGVSIPASSTLSLTVPTKGALLFAGTMTVAYTPDADYTPIVLKGTNAKVAGLKGAVIDGQGSKYWDGEGSNGGTAKPDHFIKLSDMQSSSFSDIKIQNWPTHLFEITGCTGMTIYNVILDNSAGADLGHNTDAFDVSSTTNLYVNGATVYNQDDCVAVNSGSDMVFNNMYCSGGHGLSIGSIADDVTVKNVTFQDSTVVDSANACRIKTDAGDSGSTVSDITYSNIAVSGITTYAIDIQQDYENGSPTGDPTTGITVSGVAFKDISGTVSSDAYNWYVLCGSTSSCMGITWSGISLTGGKTSCSPASLCSSA
ncbi:glycoside hydrolase family 28 protein [Amniculicola lignicola CBS 123094]|uniref:endo-polygalacturonase n=1 Tax=Amniculicola lignicola CBS 123094 TaxID=1392246 RepID=A0A6A5X3S8_9PLEO|nr:glycoside hydrolase family 28 protein [Amniculicola lignicola CBS 123094]